MKKKLDTPSIHLFPGFLGQTSDWPNDCPGIKYDWPKEKISLQAHAAAILHQLPKKPIVGVGYSMGGRFLLELMRQAPNKFAGALFLSTHPGLSQPETREIKFAEAKIWAEKFSSLAWDPLMSLWDTQPIFHKSPSIKRYESNYSRPSLAYQLIHWSIAIHAPYLDVLEKAKCPLFWVVGKEDEKYVALSKTVAFSHPASCVIQLPGIGHRIVSDPRITKLVQSLQALLTGRTTPTAGM